MYIKRDRSSRSLASSAHWIRKGAVLGLEQQKMSEGKELIRYFCTPYYDEDGKGSIAVEQIDITPTSVSVENKRHQVLLTLGYTF